jgi:hypothetical protein
MDNARTRRRADANPSPQSPIPNPYYQPIAAIAIDAVTPSDRGFTLTGPGAPPDRARYRLELRFELPLDPRTRTVLGELLSQSDLTVSRRDTAPSNS